MLITSIKQAKKRESRVNIYIDNAFWIGLDKNDLLHFNLHKGKELSVDEMKEIEKTASFNKILDKAINYTFVRPRSEAEMKTYLTLKRGVTEEEADSMLSKLKKKGFLDDRRFTEWFVDNRVSFGFHGENKIKAELAKKGVSPSIIKEIISNKLKESDVLENQEEKIREFIKKNIGKIKGENNFEIRTKLINKLLSRGFRFNDIQNIVKEYI